MGCVDLCVISVDCGKDVSVNIAVKQTTETITEVINKNKQSAITSIDLGQDIEVDITGKITNSNINLQNVLKGKISVLNNLSQEITTQIQQNIIDLINNNVKQLSETQTELLSKAISGSTTTNVSSELSNIVKNVITNENINNIISNAYTLQKNKLTIHGDIDGSTITIGNTMLVDLTIQNIAKMIVNNNAISLIQTQIDNDVSQENKDISKGLNDIISTVADMIKSLGLGWIIGIAIIAVALILFLPMILKAFAGTSEAIKKDNNKSDTNKRKEGEKMSFGRRKRRYRKY